MSFQLCDRDCHPKCKPLRKSVVSSCYRSRRAARTHFNSVSWRQTAVNLISLGDGFTNGFRVQRFALFNSGYMLMSQSTAPLPNFTETGKDGMKVDNVKPQENCFVLLASGRLPSFVLFSPSPKNVDYHCEPINYRIGKYFSVNIISYQLQYSICRLRINKICYQQHNSVCLFE